MDNDSEKSVPYASCTLTKSEMACTQIECKSLALVLVFINSTKIYMADHIWLVISYHLLYKTSRSKVSIPTMAAA